LRALARLLGPPALPVDSPSHCGGRSLVIASLVGSGSPGEKPASGVWSLFDMDENLADQPPTGKAAGDDWGQIGRPKVEAWPKGYVAINPACEVRASWIFVTASNLEEH